MHNRLLGTHLDRLTVDQGHRILDADSTLDIARITARLDQLQHSRPAPSRGLGLQP